MTRSATCPSIPTPVELRNTRPLASPTSMRRRCARPRNDASCLRLRGYPSARAKSLPEPIGYSASATSVSTRPFATSFAVPSPPTAMTRRYPSSTACDARRAASPGAGVATTSTSVPAGVVERVVSDDAHLLDRTVRELFELVVELVERVKPFRKLVDRVRVPLEDLVETGRLTVRQDAAQSSTQCRCGTMKKREPNSEHEDDRTERDHERRQRPFVERHWLARAHRKPQLPHADERRRYALHTRRTIAGRYAGCSNG